MKKDNDKISNVYGHLFFMWMAIVFCVGSILFGLYPISNGTWECIEYKLSDIQDDCNMYCHKYVAAGYVSYCVDGCLNSDISKDSENICIKETYVRGK